MRIAKQQLEISASDLAKHLACGHLTSLDLRAARGEIDRPYWHDPAIAVFQERGFRHEAACLSHLKDRGHTVLRFNVATSRARCACILVASPLLFEPDCQTPHQMKLANALCRYLEMAETVDLTASQTAQSL